MARYSKGFKQRAVARLLPPESSPVEVVSREIGISTELVSESVSRSGGNNFQLPSPDSFTALGPPFSKPQ
jgi:transposase-like protein